jgi:serine O-acetyltransferase
MGMTDRVREDINVVFSKDPAARSVWEVICCYPGLHAIWMHRVAHWLWKHRLRLPGRLVSHVNRWITGIEIHPGATIGRRFFVDHGMGVVIGETSEVGDDVLMYQGVVLGGTTLEKTKRHPTIGNNVVIGTGATVLGAIEVGDNARIGAGSVVVRSVPAGTTVVGVPARVTGRPERGTRSTDLRHSALPDPVARAISETLDRQSRLEERVKLLEKQLSVETPLVPAGTGGRIPAAPGDLGPLVWGALDEVIDPEAGISVVELGLIQYVEVEDSEVRVGVYIAAEDCPFLQYLVDQIARRAKMVNGTESVEVTLLERPASGRRKRGKRLTTMLGEVDNA